MMQTHASQLEQNIAASLPDSLVSALTGILGDRFKRGDSVRDIHGRDESAVKCMPPQAVAYAHSHEEVVQIVSLCHRHKVPVIPYGTGTSLEGQLQAIRGGVCIDVSEMNRILSIRRDDMDVTLQPGVTRKQLNNALHGTGLFFPIDPGADASIGGMAATRASGTNAVRYGTMRENVLNMTVVLPDGKTLKTGGRARKSAAGYDLTRLFVGSGGTLGLITELTVKLHPLPESVSSAVCTFPSVGKAVQTVIETIQMGVPVARIELLDALSIQAINVYSKTSLTELPTLFFEFHGSDQSVKEQAEVVQELARGNDGTHFEWALRPEDRSRLWQARHDAYFAALALCPGKRAITTDAVVPISALSACIEETVADFQRYGLTAPVLGHVGDGNFHAIVLVDPDDADEMQRAHEATSRLVERAIRFEGSCTGEHGIGLTKQQYLAQEFGEAGVQVMTALKKAIDPDNLFNPDKIVRL